jgi:hypothetical protein
MATAAVFPQTSMGAGMYESFYLRTVSAREPVGAWIRHTVHKAPGRPARGSLWCTIFDAARGRPLMHKLTSDELEVPADGWIAVGRAGGAAADEGRAAEGPGEGGRLTPELAEGRCGPARWALRWSAQESELRHLPRSFLYRTRLPRTKLTSPAPRARFQGTIEIAGREPLEVHDWAGMVGHNWGAEHAERWIWLHGIDFAESEAAWLDVAIGRVKVGRMSTPWVANGALSLDGRRYRIGGLGARGLRVAESPQRCRLHLAGESGLALDADVEVPAETAAGWRYTDPDGSPHDVANCSIARLSIELTLPGADRPRSLTTDHGGAYELGMREQDHGVPLAPFRDG